MPIDHLVVTAPTLAVGLEYVADTLGVMPVPGGVHPRMGTHNALLHLGEGTYLEVIAVDPDIEPPAWPRWFDLDRVGPRDAPRLAAWVYAPATCTAPCRGPRFHSARSTRCTEVISRGRLPSCPMVVRC